MAPVSQFRHLKGIYLPFSLGIKNIFLLPRIHHEAEEEAAGEEEEGEAEEAGDR